MNSPRTTRRSARRGFISAKLAVVLAVIALAGGLLAYEWHHADSAKTRRPPAYHRHFHDSHAATSS